MVVQRRRQGRSPDNPRRWRSRYDRPRICRNSAPSLRRWGRYKAAPPAPTPGRRRASRARKDAAPSARKISRKPNLPGIGLTELHVPSVVIQRQLRAPRRDESRQADEAPRLRGRRLYSSRALHRTTRNLAIRFFRIGKRRWRKRDQPSAFEAARSLSYRLLSIVLRATRALASASTAAVNMTRRKPKTKDWSISRFSAAFTFSPKRSDSCAAARRSRCSATSERTSAGRFWRARRLSNSISNECTMMIPSAAMPKSAPIRDMALFTPEAAPARFAGTEFITVVVSGATL